MQAYSSDYIFTPDPAVVGQIAKLVPDRDTRQKLLELFIEEIDRSARELKKAGYHERAYGREDVAYFIEDLLL